MATYYNPHYFVRSEEADFLYEYNIHTVKFMDYGDFYYENVDNVTFGYAGYDLDLEIYDADDVYVETIGSAHWVTIDDAYDVNINMMDGSYQRVIVTDADDVIVITDGGGHNYVRVADADLTVLSSGGGDNTFDVDNVDALYLSAQAGGNTVYVDDVLDDISMEFGKGWNIVHVHDSDSMWYQNDLDITVQSYGSNQFYVSEVDTATIDVAGGYNTFRIYNMDDSLSNEYVNLITGQGYNTVDIDDVDDVKFEAGFRYGAYGHNTVDIYDANFVDIDIGGGSNWIQAQWTDNVDMDITAGSNTIRVYHADDVDIDTGGTGYNWVHVVDVDDLDMTMAGGHNRVYISAMDDSFYAEDIWININDGYGNAGYNYFNLYDVDDVFIDTDAGHNTAYIIDANNVNLQFDQAQNGWNNITVQDAWDVKVVTTEGANVINLYDIDDVDINTVGWSNDIDINYADAVYIHNTWGSSAYQDIDVNHADDVTIDMFKLQSSNIWINDADDVQIDSTGGRSNTVNVQHADRVDIDMDGGYHAISAHHTDALFINTTGGSNWIDVSDADSLTMTLGSWTEGWGGNVVNIYDMDDSVLYDENVWINVNDQGAGYNTFNISDVDDVWIDTDGGGYNTVNIHDANDVTLNFDQYGNKHNTITIDDADDVNILTTEGGNVMALSDVDDVDIDTVGWSNTIDIYDADDVNIHNTWGWSGYQDIDVEWADDVTVNMNNLYNSTIDIDRAEDVTIIGTGTHGGNMALNLGMDSGSSVEDVYIRLLGPGNTINIDSSALFDDEVTIDVQAEGTVNVSAYGPTVDIDLRGSSRDTVNVGGLYASVYTYAGDDTVNVGAVAADVDTGAGDDTVNLGAAGANVNTGAGADTVNAGAFYAHIDTGDGDDTVHAGAAGSWIDTGAGDDTLYLGGLAAYVNAGAGDDTIYSLSVGGQAIIAGEGNNEVYAIGGVNYVESGAGFDTIVAAGGANVISSGAGDDIVAGLGAGNFIKTGAGKDSAIALGGLNFVTTGDGNDVAIALGGVNIVSAGAGDDVVVGGGGYNLLFGGGGSDTLIGYGAGNLILGDQLLPEGLLVGAEQAYKDNPSSFGGINPSEAIDTTDPGDDTLLAVGMKNIMMAGGGDDTVVAVGAANMIFSDDLAAGIGGDDSVVAIGVGNKIVTGGGDDLLVAVGKTNILGSGAGSDDILVGGMLNLVFTDGGGLAGFGASVVSALGNLVWDGVQYAYNETIDPETGDSVDLAAFVDDLDRSMNQEGGGDDTVIAGGLGNIIFGGAGADNIHVTGGGNLIYSGDGNDFITATSVSNFLYGGAGDDTIVDFGLKSQVSGGDGDDTIVGAGFGLFEDANYLIEDALNDFADVVDGFLATADTLIGGIADAVDYTEFLPALGATGDAESAEYVTAFFDMMSGDLDAAIYDLFHGEGDEVGIGDLEASDGATESADNWAEEAVDDFLATFAQDIPSMSGGAGDDIIVSGFGFQAISGGEGSDTYIAYENEGVDVIIDDGSGAGDTDVLQYNLDTDDPATALHLGDIFFTSDGYDLMISGGFTTLIQGMGAYGEDAGDWGVETLRIDYGESMFEFDLEAIFESLEEDVDVSLADLLGMNQDDSFNDLAALLDEAVDETNGTVDESSIDGAVDLEYLDTFIDESGTFDVDHQV